MYGFELLRELRSRASTLLFYDAHKIDMRQGEKDIDNETDDTYAANLFTADRQANIAVVLRINTEAEMSLNFTLYSLGTDSRMTDGP